MAKGKAYYQNLARQAAIANGIDPEIFARQISAESGFNPNAGSSAGAIGIAQIMPATARGWGVNPRDPQAALNAAAKNMAHYVKAYGGWRNALTAYNAGPGRVGKPLYAETANYINKILGGTNPKALPGGTQHVANSNAPVSNSNAAALALIFKGSPLEGMDFGTAAPPPAPVAAAPSQPAGKNLGAFTFLPRQKGEEGWHYLQRVGATGGLRNDPGNNQTTGGKHVNGSDHYRHTAIDFGDGANGTKRLNQWDAFLEANRKALGLKQIIWQAPGHYDHIHASTLR